MISSTSFSLGQASTQENEGIEGLATSQVDKKKLSWSIIIGSSAYAVTSITLYHSWYKDYGQSRFHFYNDWNQWRNVDKAGHMYAGYFQSSWAFDGWRWTGMKEKHALIAGAATSFVAQTTIEVLDGFSDEWGFSIPDFTANLIGIGAFVSQQALWKEQKIRFKTSLAKIDYKKKYSDEIFESRANELFGRSVFTSFLKDYNAQTTWMSFNLDSFFPKMNLPKWLNLAVGYGAENMFGGYTNSGLGSESAELSRYSQFYISLDADLSRIKTQSPLLRTVLDILNILKVPFSTIEINTLGEVKFFVIKF